MSRATPTTSRSPAVRTGTIGSCPERAVVVVERLQDVAHVNPAQLYIVGFGQYHPIVPNTSRLNQSKNRRVNIVITVPGQKVALP